MQRHAEQNGRAKRLQQGESSGDLQGDPLAGQTPIAGEEP